MRWDTTLGAAVRRPASCRSNRFAVARAMLQPGYRQQDAACDRNAGKLQNRMHHNISLVTTLAAAFGVALILGFVAERIKVPALVGYLVAGIVIGPATPGFVADVQIASQLADIGVMLLNVWCWTALLAQ